MKRFLAILGFVAMAFVGVSTTAVAESVTISPLVIDVPESWTQNTKDVNTHRVAVFVDPNTENRIEVYSRNATRSAHANVLFDAFHDHLLNNEMTSVEKPADYTVECLDGSILKGKRGEYNYESSDIPVSVVTYSFVTHNDTAFIVVGYFVRANRDEGIQAFDAMLKKITNASAK